MFRSLLLIVCALSLQAAVSLDEILARVRAATAEFEAAVPDFVARETLTSSKIVNGRMVKESKAESLFTCVRNTKSKGWPFIEARELMSLNGKPVPKGQKLKGPYVITGGFSLLLRATFSEKNARYQNLRIALDEPTNTRPAIVVAFETKEGQKEMGLMMDGHGYVTRDTGKAWIDPDSLRALSIERTYGNLPHGIAITNHVTFMEAIIDSKPYWVPRTVSSVREGNGATYRFTAEYSNYKKFAVSSEIKFENQPN